MGQPSVKSCLRAVVVVASLLCASSTVADEVWITLPAGEPDALQPGDVRSFEASGTANTTDLAGIVRTVFPEAYGPDVLARMFVEAPFTGEEMVVAVSARSGNYRVVAAASPRWLWQYTSDGAAQAREFHQQLVPADYRDVPVKRCSRKLKASLATDVVEVWRRMLRHAVRPSVLQPPVDDAFAYFSVVDGDKMLAGWTWTSFEKPRVAALIGLAFDLDDYCMTGRTSSLVSAQKEVDTLLASVALNESP